MRTQRIAFEFGQSQILCSNENESGRKLRQTFGRIRGEGEKSAKE